MALLISGVQLSKSFSGKDILKKISFGIEDGEKVALLGPNGVGKSTLMKIIMKKMAPDTGEVVYRKGLRLGYLDQTPEYAEDDSIASYVLNNYDLDPDKLTKAYELMAKMELSQFAETMLIKDMSGGWRKRAALCKELLQEPDLLLLDEPTNHLDVPSIKWLETFLSECRFATLIVTHDRLFLQRVANKILDLDPRFPGHLLSVTGGYEKYLEAKTNMAAEQLSREAKLSNTLRREKEWLARGAKARQTKQTARQDSAYALASEVENLKNLNRNRGFDLSFENTEKGPQKLVVAEKLGKKSFQDPNSWLFRNVNLVITPKTRIALMGVNGAGKSTLIRVFLEQMQYDEGKMRKAEDLQFAYFEQGRETLNPQKSVLKNILPEGDYVDFRGSFVHARSYLERFGFSKDKAELPVAQLSGGEQARLRIAQLMLRKCQILILDEPTNDLDIETLNTLEESLKDFDGAVILVTHDRYFMDQVSNQILSFSPFKDDQGEVLVFAEYEQWEDWYDARLASDKIAKKEAASGKSKSKAKISYKDKLEFENMEANIQTLEADIAQLQKELADPNIAADAGKIKSLYESLGTKQAELEQKFARWSELEEKMKL